MAYHKNIRLLALHNFFTDFVFFAPVAIIYFSRVTGSMALGMSIFSAAYISSAFFEVPTGILSDFVGRKKTVILGSTSSILCLILYAIGGSYVMLLIGALFQGLSRSFFSGNNDALLHDCLQETNEENQYYAHLGRTSAMFQISLALASVSGSIIASWSFALVMWASVVPQLCALIVAFQLKEPAVISHTSSNIYAHLGEALRQFHINRKLKLLTIASVIRFSLIESIFFFRSVFINMLWPLWAIGISYMLSNIGAAFSFYFSGKIIDKFGSWKILQFEILSNRVVNLFALIFPTVVSPVLMGSTSLTFGTSTVAINSLMQKEFTSAQRATMSSINSFFGNIAFGISAVALGSLADHIGIITTLIIAHILLLSPLVFYRKIFSTE